jgi:hypothetical protein
VAFRQSLVPMQPMLGKPFDRPGWIYEEKYDGWRMLAFKDGPRVQLINRQAVNHTDRFRELVAAIAALKAPTLILDSEVCVFDKSLLSQFHLLDRGASDEPCTPPVFMAFDCLHVHGLDVREKRFVVGGVVGWPHTFAGLLVGQQNRTTRALSWFRRMGAGPPNGRADRAPCARNERRRRFMTFDCRAVLSGSRRRFTWNSRIANS